MTLVRDKAMLIGIVIGLILFMAGLICLVLLGGASSQPLPADPALSLINSSAGKTAGRADSKTKVSGIPVRIEIPSVGINLKVVPGYYNAQTELWTLSLNDAQFAQISAPANNEGGLTFIYGHYRSGVFMNLHLVTPGASAKLVTDNRHIFSYVFRRSITTVPQDTSFLSYEGKPIMVVQTCSGPHFENRQLFVFDFSEVKA
ncbi:MAG TPA: sortase [Candidatus Saccharimonadales bacterium]|nr:sortase [Candidatus Saccharimonadales bacterium]